MANILMQLYFAQQMRDQNEPSHYSQEERVERRAELLKQAEEIRAQMYSPKQERLLKCATYGSVGAMSLGMLVALFYSHYMNQKGAAYNELKAAAKQYVVDEKLLTDLSAQSWYAFKMCFGSLAGGLAALIPGNYFGKKLDLNNELTKKLEDIQKQIAELDVLDAAEIQNDVVEA